MLSLLFVYFGLICIAVLRFVLTHFYLVLELTNSCFSSTEDIMMLSRQNEGSEN